MSKIFLDRFTAGLDELTRKQQASPDHVLRQLLRQKQYSVFEATANDTIANTMTGLIESGKLKVENEQYPWTRVTHINGVKVTTND